MNGAALFNGSTSAWAADGAKSQMIWSEAIKRYFTRLAPGWRKCRRRWQYLGCLIGFCKSKSLCRTEIVATRARGVKQRFLAVRFPQRRARARRLNSRPAAARRIQPALRPRVVRAACLRDLALAPGRRHR